MTEATPKPLLVRDLVAVLVRLLAVIVALHGSTFLTDATMLGLGTDVEGTSIFALPGAMALALAVVLWLCPRLVAGLVVPGGIGNTAFTGLDADALEQAGLGLLGVYVLSWAVPDLAMHAALLAELDAAATAETVFELRVYLGVTLVELVVGVVLALRARGIQAVLARLRRAGT